MLRIIKVTGNSLSPFFLPGDYVIAWRSLRRFNRLSPGDHAVFFHHDFGLLIKRVVHNDPSGRFIEAEGNLPDSLSAKQIGDIPYENIVGKVILRIPSGS
jgi:phage repressor protein C with HTH and peptisase S24 domain